MEFKNQNLQGSNRWTKDWITPVREELDGMFDRLSHYSYLDFECCYWSLQSRGAAREQLSDKCRCQPPLVGDYYLNYKSLLTCSNQETIENHMTAWTNILHILPSIWPICSCSWSSLSYCVWSTLHGEIKYQQVVSLKPLLHEIRNQTWSPNPVTEQWKLYISKFFWLTGFQELRNPPSQCMGVWQASSWVYVKCRL